MDWLIKAQSGRFCRPKRCLGFRPDKTRSAVAPLCEDELVAANEFFHGGIFYPPAATVIGLFALKSKPALEKAPTKPSDEIGAT